MKTLFNLVVNKKEVIKLLSDFNVEVKIKGDTIVADTMDTTIISMVDELILAHNKEGQHPKEKKNEKN